MLGKKNIPLLILICLSIGCAESKNENLQNADYSSIAENQDGSSAPELVPASASMTMQASDEPRPVDRRRIPEKERAIMLDHKYFQVKYLPKYRLPKYVRYVLTADHLRVRRATRSKFFRLDSMLIHFNIQPVLPQDYFRSGYDRGHLAPSADFLWDQKANDETFVMSNIAPQSAQLNTGSWLELEDRVRGWACKEERLIVIAGPVVQANLRRMRSGVAIPQKFFKIILDDTPPRKAIGFIFDQNDQENHLRRIQISPDRVSKIIGEDFSSEFPMQDRMKLRETPEFSHWRESSCFRRLH